MFSRCPHCDSQQPVSTQQLRDSRGLLACASCGKAFDALPTLTEQADEAVDTQQHADLPFSLPDQATVPDGKGWPIGSALLLMVLLGQIGYFESDGLLRQPQIHQALTRICRIAGCRMPAYKNPAEWSLSHSEWQAHLDNRYVLTAALTNQSAFAQDFPDLKLTLNDYSGRPLAERLFHPASYTRQRQLAARQTERISLPLVVAAPDVAGFTLTMM